MVDMTMLSINIQEKHLETAEALDTKSRTVKLIIVTHDFLEDICAAALI